MVDLMQTAYLEDSSEYAAIMSSEFNDGSRIISRGLRQAGFFVLNGAHMPSILLELGYISNSIEEELLGDNDYQDELARRIYGGIESCIERNHRRFDQ
jgi:N-acetylmuramoyl-L-alanine amidase